MRGSEFAELGAFVAVAERGSFARAAAHLHLAPSTLSQTVRALEERLGVGLFHRTTRSVALTEAGERLLAGVGPAIGDLQGAVEAIGHFRDTPTGTLRLSVSSVPAQIILAPLLKGFLAAYPSISLDIAVDDTTSDIVSGRFDAGIRYGRRIERDMVLVRASPRSRIIAVASPGYLAAHSAPRTPMDLQGHPCIRFRLVNHLVPWEFEKNRRKVEVAVGGPLVVNDVDLMVRAARDGIGIGYMVEAYVADDLREGRLVALLTDWSPPFHSYYLYHASRRQLPVPLRVFIEFLKNRMDAAGKGA
jgi:DNA-binding transcriptional LysR family regulator